MKTLCALLLALSLTCVAAYGQSDMPKEFVPSSGTINLSSQLPFCKALKALNVVSSRLDKKVILDEKQRTEPIGVEINHMYWRDALEMIAETHGLAYDETSKYIRIVDQQGGPVMRPSQAGGARAPGEREYSSQEREVNISAIFFEGDRYWLQEQGINWNAVIKKGSWFYGVEQPVAGNVNVDITNPSSQFIPGQTTSGAAGAAKEEKIQAFLTALESNSKGDVLASPNIQVLEGQEGRVQVGQDISIKQVDFAGNVIDRFISTGIILLVTPLVVDEDSLQFIHLNISAERSSAQPGAISTIINKTQANTELMLLNGERAVIAGLYSTYYTHERRGIPGLKDLPWWVFGLRYLTGVTKSEQSEKELIIILKAELVPSLNAREIAQGSTREYITDKREQLMREFRRDDYRPDQHPYDEFEMPEPSEQSGTPQE